MDDFLDRYLQLANRNQNIIISKGSLSTDTIFNRNITKKNIEKIIDYLNNQPRHKKKYYTETIYQKANEEIKLSSNNEYSYTIFNDLDYYMDKNYLLKWRNYSTDNVIIPSYSDFDNIVKREVVEYFINNLTFKIILENDAYNWDIIIFKPTPKENIVRFMKDIRNI